MTIQINWSCLLVLLRLRTNLQVPLPDMLALVNDEVMISHDGGRNWHEGFPAQSADGLTAVAAPEGIWPGAPLVIGRNDGEITCVSLSY